MSCAREGSVVLIAGSWGARSTETKVGSRPNALAGCGVTVRSTHVVRTGDWKEEIKIEQSTDVSKMALMRIKRAGALTICDARGIRTDSTKTVGPQALSLRLASLSTIVRLTSSDICNSCDRGDGCYGRKLSFPAAKRSKASNWWS